MIVERLENYSAIELTMRVYSNEQLKRLVGTKELYIMLDMLYTYNSNQLEVLRSIINKEILDDTKRIR